MNGARIIAVGGASAFGLDTTRLLAASDLVAEIVIAGRDLEAARRQAAKLGAKGRAAELDVRDAGRLARLATDADLIVNTAGPEQVVVLPALREAIDAGVSYCDLCADGLTTAAALELDASARDAGVSALLGMGEFPGLSNLMMLHAAQQLDWAESVRHCVFFGAGLSGNPREVLSRWTAAGRVEASWQLIMRLVGRASVFREGSWIIVDPAEHQVPVKLWPGFEAIAYPVGLPEPITLPRTLVGVRSVESLWAFHPPELNATYLSLGASITEGQLDESAAASRLFEHLGDVPEESLTPPSGQPSLLFTVAEAVGTKNGCRTRFRCWRRGDWPTTEAFLAAAALKMLRGEIGHCGVIPPESCLEPMAFLREVTHQAGLHISPEDLLDSRLETLE
jgi:hypothetical protein